MPNKKSLVCKSVVALICLLCQSNLFSPLKSASSYRFTWDTDWHSLDDTRHIQVWWLFIGPSSSTTSPDSATVDEKKSTSHCVFHKALLYNSMTWRYHIRALTSMKPNSISPDPSLSRVLKVSVVNIRKRHNWICNVCMAVGYKKNTRGQRNKNSLNSDSKRIKQHTKLSKSMVRFGSL